MAQGNIEEWLQNLEVEMQRSVRRECRKPGVVVSACGCLHFMSVCCLKYVSLFEDAVLTYVFHDFATISLCDSCFA